jgi:hypothetical protein
LRENHFENWPPKMDGTPMEEANPVIPEYFIGDIVAVTEFKRPTVGNKVGIKVLGGIARITKVDEKTCDLNYYLEGRRVKEVPFEYMMRAPPSFEGASPLVSDQDASGAASASSSGPTVLDPLPGSWEAQALRQAETLARAGSKRERKQAIHFEVTKHETQSRRNKQAKQPTAGSPKSSAAAGGGGRAASSKGAKTNESTNKIMDSRANDNAIVKTEMPTLPVLPRNTKAFKQGKWRREPFDLRE